MIFDGDIELWSHLILSKVECGICLTDIIPHNVDVNPRIK